MNRFTSRTNRFTTKVNQFEKPVTRFVRPVNLGGLTVAPGREPPNRALRIGTTRALLGN